MSSIPSISDRSVTDSDRSVTEENSIGHSKKARMNRNDTPAVTDSDRDSGVFPPYAHMRTHAIGSMPESPISVTIGHSEHKTSGQSSDSSALLPTWFEPTPFPYQLTGAIRAAELNHTLIADEPGLGKTLQALATAVMLDAQRVLVIAPPVLLANWGREITRSHHLEHIDGAELLTVTPSTKKVTEGTLPAAGYVIVSDAMLVSRRTMTGLLSDWAPDVLVIDEAHRMKNPGAKRTRAVAQVSAAAGKTIALTGTPIISTPLDVLPLLDMLGHIGWFPGGTRKTFEDRYTVPDRWGNARPFKKRLPELHALLEAFVWTRRTKAAVLTDLPAKLRTTHTIIPSHDDYVAAHKDLDAAVDKYLDQNPNIDMEHLRGWAADNRRYVSQLRRATGLAKIEPAVDWIREHHDGAPDRPLIVWGIHRAVLDGLAEQLGAHMRVTVIHGGTGHAERDDVVQAFQAGEIDVLVAQIVAAGVGLTLTRSSDVLFVETDWTPAGVVQAEDRVHRIGQTASVQITTLIAERTLDAKIHATLATSIQTLDQLTPGSDHAVTDAAGAATVRDVLVGLVLDRHITRLTNGAAA